MIDSRTISLHKLILFASLSCLASQSIGQEGLLENHYPKLQQLLLAHDVVQARAYEEVGLTNDSPAAAIGQRLLLETLNELAEAEGSHYHSAGDHLAMLGPHRVFESRATPGLLGTIREIHDAEEVRYALEETANLPAAAVAALQYGRQFYENILAVYLNPSYEDKDLAIDQLVSEYLANDLISVPAAPKADELLSDHPYAYAYRVGFPQLSGLTWGSQWLKVALLEIVVSSKSPEVRDRDIAAVIEGYERKTIRLHGSFASLPSDIPTIPVIAPNFYSRHPEASYIIDNLETLKVVIGDVLAYPELANRDTLIQERLASYTDKSNYLAAEMNYLTYVLRGGIYNAGGPARGGMSSPDRNWTREQVENPHISPNPMSQ